MKFLKIIVIAFVFTFTLFGGNHVEARSYRTKSSDVHVKAYYRKDGTYVNAHYRSKADGIISNNYSCIDDGKCGSSNTVNGVSTVPSPVQKKVVAPENAYVSGSNWYCLNGFREVGNTCQKVVAPENAYVSGSNWYCLNGFREVGNTCQKVVAPENAYVSGSNWYCLNGFREVGNTCQKVVAPENAYVSGSNWYCLNGFREVGNTCQKVN